MKTIGMIGGMSWESTLTYYRRVNEITRERLGGLNSAPLILSSVNFAEFSPLLEKRNWSGIARNLSVSAGLLERAGAECAILCTNTMHKVYDSLRLGVSIPILHIADALGEKLVAQGIRKVGLLGTRFTLRDGFFAERLAERFDVETLIPAEEDVDRVNAVIFEELCLGKINEESRSFFRRAIGGLEKKGAEGIALACTEIEMLVKPGDADAPIFDTAEIHSEHAVNWALGETDSPAEAKAPHILSAAGSLPNSPAPSKFFND